MGPAHLPITNGDFLTAVFGEEHRKRAYVTGFAQDPTEAKTPQAKGRMWGGGELRNGGSRRIKNPDDRKLNTFVTISIFGPDEQTGRAKRRKGLLQSTHLIVADDIAAGPEPGPGSKWADNGILDIVYGLAPSYILETSPGNTQWGWILTEPETRGWLIDRIQDKMIELGLAADAKDPGMKGVTRYVRLPEGWNTKAKYGKDGFRCGMLQWHPEITYDTEELAQALGVDTTEPAPHRPLDRVDLEEDDPVLAYLADEGCIKGPIPGKPGAWDVLCPWVDSHSERDDSGTAYFQAGYVDGTGEQYLKGGFSCHHGHCEDRTRQDVIAWLTEKGHDVEGVLDMFEEVVEEQVAPSRIDARVDYQSRLKEAVDEAEVAAVCREVRGDDRVDDLAREVLLKGVQEALTRITGTNISLSFARKTLRGKKEEKVPKWLKPWTYFSEGDAFLNLKTGQVVTHRAFTSMFGSKLGDDAPPADLWALDNDLVKKVRGQRYMPGNELYFTEDGSDFVNSYRPPDPPKLEVDWDDEDRAAIETFKRHLRNMIPDRRERRILWSWLCYKVQAPGERINWAMLLCGTTGDGKSLFTELMSLMLGDSNVDEVNGTTLESRFNGWAEGNSLVAFEEVRHIGHNRHDVFNSIKTAVTNRKISIERKGMDAYTVPNKTSYLAYTNHLAALPLTEEDRRVFLVRMRYESKSELRAMLAEQGGESAYWAPVYASYREHADAFRGWMTEFPLDKEFVPFGDAPWTEAKDDAIRLAENDSTALIRDAVASGDRGVSENLLSMAHLAQSLGEQSRINSTVLSRVLSEDGWYRLNFSADKSSRQRIRWESMRTTVWARKESGFPRHALADKGKAVAALEALLTRDFEGL